MSKKVLILDVETIDLKKPWIYEFSYLLLDLETGETKVTMRLTEEVYDSPLFSKAYYYHKNKHIYEQLVDDRKAEIMSLADIRQEFNDVIAHEDISYFSAYNMKFDLRAINSTFEHFNVGNKAQLNYDKIKRVGIKPLDVGVLFMLTEGREPCYRCFCKKNGFYTKNNDGSIKNYKTTAEIVYRYHINKPLWEEAHIGGMDCLIEADIFRHGYQLASKNPEVIDLAVQVTERGTPLHSLLNQIVNNKI